MVVFLSTLDRAGRLLPEEYAKISKSLTYKPVNIPFKNNLKHIPETCVRSRKVMTLDLSELNLTPGLDGVSLLLPHQSPAVRPIYKPWVSIVYVGSLFIGSPGGNRSRDRIDRKRTVVCRSMVQH